MIVDLLLDPDKALDAVNKAVSLVKKASQTAQNVESLAPLLGRYFDAKANAIATMEKAKAGGFGGSAMGKALELEMAIESQREFEEQLKGLFFPHKMDVWQKIKARATMMEAEAAKAAGAEKRRLAAAKKKQDEAVEIVLGVGLAVLVVIALLWGIYEVITYCHKGGCG